MLEKPSIADEMILTAVQAEYGLAPAQLSFLPIGADLHTAAYRFIDNAGRAWFLKLRSGIFDETSVTLPKFLHDQGIAQIIPPLPGKSGQLWARLDGFTLILYPFIDGRDGYQVDLSDRHWIDFGAAVKKIHNARIPTQILHHIRRETYPPHGRKIVKQYLARLDELVPADATAAELAQFLKAHKAVTDDLVARAGHLAAILQADPPPFTLCHSDLHAGNILVEPGGAFYIVDLDDPIIAPKERDLMYPGGAQGFRGHTPQQEEALFFQGYGRTPVDPRALAYYRFERIVQDIAIFCEQIFTTAAGGEDREQALIYLKSNFSPGNTIEAAYR